jgi:hypothetical protein
MSISKLHTPVKLKEAKGTNFLTHWHLLSKSDKVTALNSIPGATSSVPQEVSEALNPTEGPRVEPEFEGSHEEKRKLKREYKTSATNFVNFLATNLPGVREYCNDDQEKTAIDKADLPKVFDLLDRIATAWFPDQLIDELEANVLNYKQAPGQSAADYLYELRGLHLELCRADPARISDIQLIRLARRNLDPTPNHTALEKLTSAAREGPADPLYPKLLSWSEFSINIAKHAELPSTSSSNPQVNIAQETDRRGDTGGSVRRAGFQQNKAKAKQGGKKFKGKEKNREQDAASTSKSSGSNSSLCGYCLSRGWKLQAETHSESECQAKRTRELRDQQRDRRGSSSEPKRPKASINVAQESDALSMHDEDPLFESEDL